MADIQEFQSFRETGELSDITICVGNKDYKLHRFPLYARSAYIKAFVVDHEEDESPKITIENFPGENEVFEIVADFCYGLHISINAANVVALRCAAERLEMSGPGNLIAKTESYIKDILNTSRVTRRPEQVISILTAAFSNEEVAKSLDIPEKCIEALVDMWLKGPTSRYSRAVSGSRDSNVQDKLLELPKDWFVQLITKARDSGAKSSLWGECVQKYVARQFDEVQKQKEAERGAAAAAKTEALQNTSEDKDAGEKTSDVEAEAQSDLDRLEEAKVAENKTENQEPLSLVDEMNHDEQEEFAKVLDSVLSELPDGAPLAEGLSPSWVINSLAIASKFDCPCRCKLLNLACQVLPKLPRDEVVKFEPAVMVELIEKVSSIEGCDRAAAVLVSDAYLLDRVKQGFRDIEVVQALVAATQKEDRTQYDVLFEVIESLLAAKDTEEVGQLTEDQIASLFSVIDFQKLGEETLQRAYDSKIVPEAHITQAALALCSKLRTQLDTAKSIVRMQEEELQRIKYGSLPSYRSVLPLETTPYSRAATSLETSSDMYSAPPSYSRTYAPLDLSFSEYAMDKSLSDSYTRPLQKPDLTDDYVARRLHWSLTGK